MKHCGAPLRVVEGKHLQTNNAAALGLRRRSETAAICRTEPDCGRLAGAAKGFEPGGQGACVALTRLRYRTHDSRIARVRQDRQFGTPSAVESFLEVHRNHDDGANLTALERREGLALVDDRSVQTEGLGPLRALPRSCGRPRSGNGRALQWGRCETSRSIA